MSAEYIPAPDTLTVAWGWFQFFLQLTFPIHLLAMNVMIGCLAVAVVQHFWGGALRERLAHRLVVALPLVIAFVVNFGVAPLLFLQVMYGQFIYTSSILMGVIWILIIPTLIVAYYGAYLYDFRFARLGLAGALIGFTVLVLFLGIGFCFSNNMLLMLLPDRFADYFQNRAGTMLVFDRVDFLPRYLHMMLGAIAVGGLGVAVIGRFQAAEDRDLAKHARAVGLKTFSHATLANVGVGIWYLLSLERHQQALFMGGNIGATVVFAVALIMTVAGLWLAIRGHLQLTVAVTVALVYLMSFQRSWLRSEYLGEFFNLDQLKVVPEYGSLVLFLVTLAGGVICLGWLWSRTVGALRQR